MRPRPEWVLFSEEKNIQKITDKTKTAETLHVSSEPIASTCLHSMLELSQGHILLSSGSGNLNNSNPSLELSLPLPIFKYKNSKDKYLINSEVFEKFGELVSKHGINVWKEWAVEDLLPEKFKVFAPDLVKLEHTFLDEKFINACCLAHLSSEAYGVQVPLDLVVEGKDSIQN
jgi:hypothetical protein